MLKLRELRKQKSLSMKELGAILGLAESTISLYENGKRKNYGYVICNPDYPISPGASRVNGFTDESVADKPLFSEIWPDIKEYFENKCK